jgi:hypothetical protein
VPPGIAETFGEIDTYWNLGATVAAQLMGS